MERSVTFPLTLRLYWLLNENVRAVVKFVLEADGFLNHYLLERNAGCLAADVRAEPEKGAMIMRKFWLRFIDDGFHSPQGISREQTGNSRSVYFDHAWPFISFSSFTDSRRHCRLSRRLRQHICLPKSL